MQPLPAFLARVHPPMTPLLVVRRAALMANLQTMQAACTAAGIRLRPHGKMHKSTDLAREQIAHGAIGLCCQTVGEAETYAAAGIADLLVTAPVPPWGWPRLAALSARTRIAAVVDSPAQIALAAAQDAGLTLYVDVDLGQHRAGVAPEHAPALARRITETQGVHYGGLQAYAGHLQHAPDRAAANTAATDILASLIDTLRAENLAPPQVTGGGTGTYALDLAAKTFTEIQAGSYALMDVDYTLAGAPAGDWPFLPALFLAATIVSAHHPGFSTCDAGLKALYTDGPAPRVLVPAGARWRSMGDEHGAIIHETPPPEASIAWLQPGHVDPTVALHDAYWLAEEDGSLTPWPIDARRKTT